MKENKQQISFEITRNIKEYLYMAMKVTSDIAVDGMVRVDDKIKIKQIVKNMNGEEIDQLTLISETIYPDIGLKH